MKFRCVIQARTTSKRLPGKVLKTLGDRPLLSHIVARLRNIQDESLEIALAIPEGDSLLVDFASSQNLLVFRGDEYDVLSRYLKSSEDLQESDYVIRLTGDNPFIDQSALSGIINQLKSQPVDYAYPRGLPLGMGFECIRVNALRSQNFYSLKEHHREHVTTFIRENPHLYEIAGLGLGPLYRTETDETIPCDIRLTIDEADDFSMAEKTWQHFNKLKNPWFGARDVVELNAHLPDFFSLNRHVKQKSAQSHEIRS